MSNIPAGYQFSVTSYENDGDNKQIINLYGQPKEDILFYIIFLKVLRQLELENLYDCEIDPETVDKFKDLMVEYYNDSVPEKYKNMYDSPDSIYDTCGKLFGNSSEFTTRYLNKYEIYFVPQEIINVSSEF